MKKLLNPIEFFNDRKLLFANLIIFVIGTVLATVLLATFDSPIDLSFSDKIVPKRTIIGNIISTLSLCLALLIAGKIINKKTRLIDCLNLGMYLRIPYYLLTFINSSYFFSDQISKIKENTQTDFLKEFGLTEMIFGYALVFFLISFLVFQVILVYRSFKTICNAKKASDYLILVSIILVFIIISSLIIRNI